MPSLFSWCLSGSIFSSTPNQKTTTINMLVDTLQRTDNEHMHKTCRKYLRSYAQWKCSIGLPPATMQCTRDSTDRKLVPPIHTAITSEVYPLSAPWLHLLYLSLSASALHHHNPLHFEFYPNSNYCFSDHKAYLKSFNFLINWKCALQCGALNVWIWLCFLILNQLFCGKRCFLFNC